MEVPSALSMGPQNAAPPDLLSMAHQAGQQALASGKVSPEEAAKNAVQLGVMTPEQAKSVLAGPKKPYDYTFGAAGKAKPPPQVKTTTTTPNTADPEMIGTQLDFLAQRPEYKDLQAGNDDLGKKLETVLAMQGPSNAWIKPLASLADSVSAESGRKTNAAASFTESGMSAADRAKTLLKYQDEIQKRKEDNYKALLSGIGQMNKNQGKTVVQVGDAGGLGSLGSARMEALRTKAGSDFDKDKLLTGVQQTQNSFKKALGFMNGNEPITKADLDLIQKDIIDGTTRSGNAAMAQVGRETINTLNEYFNHLQLYGGRVADLRKSEPQIFKHIKSKIYQLQKEQADIADERIDELHSNYAGSPYPNIVDTAQSKVDLLRKKTSGWRDEANKELAPASGGKKDTKDMSIEELKAELHGG